MKSLVTVPLYVRVVLSPDASPAELVDSMAVLARRHLAVAAAAVVTVATVLTAALGLELAALSLLGTLAGGIVVGLIYLRHRQGRLERQVQRLAKDVQTRLDKFANRLETATALERIASTERHVELTGALGSMQSELTEIIKERATRHESSTRSHLRKLEYEPVRQVQALFELFREFEPRAPLPGVGGWALEPATLLTLTHLVAKRKPKVVVECGSGASSVWLGYAVQAADVGKLVTLEHDAAFAERTRLALRDHGLTDYVEVRLAPLAPLDLDGATYQWYESNAVADLDDIGLLLVDGPPGSTGPMARYPALPVLRKALAPRAIVAIDDADRRDEREMIARWTTEMPDLRPLPTDVPGLHVLEVA
jgi:predicted O-methyltransferase YrrM